MKNVLKRSLSVFLAIAIIFSSAYVGLGEIDFGKIKFGNPFAVKVKAASSGTCGDNLTWTLDDEGTLTISGTGDMRNYSDSTKAPWYSVRSNITSVAIKNGVTSIGGYAFYICTSLESITIPDSVTSIGNSAFHWCTSLTSVTIPDGVTSINVYTFGYCESLTSITIPDGVTSIGNDAFIGCTSLSSIKIPDGVTSIGYSAFQGCKSLISITIPDSVTTIYSETFYGCASLTSITIPDSVTSIYNGSFSECTSLTSITIPDSVTGIGWGAFYSCSSLTSITFSDSLTYIDPFLFENCTSLTSITIPDSVTSIGYDAFRGCTSLESITIPDSVTSIDYDAFYGCTSLTDVHIEDIALWCNISFETTTSNPLCYAGDLYLNDELVTDLVITDATSIGDNAFYNCTSLTSVTIPDSVTSIGSSAFYSCTSLESVYITDLAAWCGINFSSSSSNPLYYADKLYVNGELATNIVIPDGVTTIPTRAFSCENIVSVTIPDSVTSIDYSAFYNCTSLTSVTIGNSVESISSSAFYNCTSLTSVTLGNSVKSISSSAFYNCTSLTSVTLGNSVESISSSAFYNCTSLTSIAVPDSVTSIGEEAFRNCASLISVNIPDSVTSIGEKAFHNCTSLASVAIGTGVTSIVPYAFYNCTSLTSVIISDSVTSIGYGTFRNCNNLTSIVIPDGVTNIGDEAFYGCCKLTSINIPDSVTKIGESAFSGCSGLTTINVSPDNTIYSSKDGVLFNKNLTKLIKYPDGKESTSYTIPDSVLNIVKAAFNTDNILTLVLGKGLSGIDAETFYSCNNLKNVVIPLNIKSIGKGAFTSWELEDVLYEGTEAQWSAMKIATGNDNLKNSQIHYNINIDEWEKHYVVSKIISAPTCNSEGSQTFTCPCGYEYTEAVPALKHNIVDGECTLCDYVVPVLESEHPYKNDCDEVYTVNCPGAVFTAVTFSADTVTEDGCDYIYIYDCNDNLVSKYTGSYLAGKTICVKGDTVKIRLTSDGSTRYYGFAVVKTEACKECIHYWEQDYDKTIYASCTKDGVDAEKCRWCGETKETIMKAYGHHYGEWHIGLESTCDSKGYKYRICYACGGHESQPIPQLKCSKPTIKTIANKDYGIRLKWKAVDGADSYKVYRKLSGGSYEYIGKTTKTAYADKTAKSGKKYYYVVKAVNEAGSSEKSASKNITFVAAPTIKTPTTTKAGITVKWSKVTGAEGYIVYRKTGSGSYERLAKVKGGTKVSYLDKSAKKGKTYSYKIEAYKGGTKSAASAVKTIKDKY